MSLKRKIDEKGGSGERKGSGQSETAYDLLLKQQQLFLQWQLENQNKVILIVYFFLTLMGDECFK